MGIKKRKGFNIALMLEKLSHVRTLTPEGSISLSGFDVLSEYESYLQTAIVAKGKSDAFVRSVVKKAIHSEQNLTEDQFIKHCNHIAGISMAKNCKAFKVLFPVWGSRSLVTGRRRWDNVSITFDIKQHSAFARRVQKERASLLQKRTNNLSGVCKEFEHLPLAVCSVKAIDVHDAFEQAENAISKELGLYSLLSSRGKFWHTMEPNTPINTVLLAPFMTVHDESGAIAADIFWHNQWPDKFSEKTRHDAEINSIRGSAEDVRKWIRKLPWRESAEMALARHYSAFSQSDLQASFLDGWRLLEAIGGANREKGETLVKRAAWFFEDRCKYHQIGLHLMHRRNLISHGRPVKEDRNENLAFQMKELVTPILHAYLTNPFSFRSTDEFWEFCDLPVDKPTRRRRAHLLECSAKFRREG